MSNYPIMISTNNHGAPMVGAHMMRAAEQDGSLADSERIFSSQMAYRVVARTGVGPRIMTATTARRLGYIIIATFPRADGSLGRGY